MKTHADCYGRLFPSVETITHEHDVAGKVFGYRVAQPGMVTTGHAITADTRAWDESPFARSSTPAIAYRPAGCW